MVFRTGLIKACLSKYMYDVDSTLKLHGCCNACHTLDGHRLEIYHRFSHVVSWVGCGTSLYQFLIFAFLLTLNMTLTSDLISSFFVSGAYIVYNK